MSLKKITVWVDNEDELAVRATAAKLARKRARSEPVDPIGLTPAEISDIAEMSAQLREVLALPHRYLTDSMFLLRFEKCWSRHVANNPAVSDDKAAKRSMFMTMRDSAARCGVISDRAARLLPPESETD